MARHDFPVVYYCTCVFLSRIRASREDLLWLKGYLFRIGLLSLLISVIFQLLCVISPSALSATVFSHHSRWSDLHVIHTGSLSRLLRFSRRRFSLRKTKSVSMQLYTCSLWVVSCEPPIFKTHIQVESPVIILIGISGEDNASFQGKCEGFSFLFFFAPAHIPPAWKLQRSRWLGITPAAQCQPVSSVCHPIQD